MSFLARRCFSTAASAAKNLKILVVDGYSLAKYEQFRNDKMDTAAVLYGQMLKRHAPEGYTVESDACNPTHPGFKMPSQDHLRQYDGIAITGSSFSVYDDDPDVKIQIDLFKEALASRRTIFGSCFAQQLCAVALGGNVEANPKGREVGPGRKIGLSEAGRTHRMFEGKRKVFESYQSHTDIVTKLPEGAVVLASNDHTNVQAMGIEKDGVESWFIQYHPEFSLDYYAKLIRSRGDNMIKLGFFRTGTDLENYVQDLETLAADPKRTDLAWKYGIDLEDMTNPEERELECKNWLKYVAHLKEK